MEIVAADASLAKRHAKLIPDLVHMTGPSAYDYQFGADRELFDPFVEAAWLVPDTLFSHTGATLAVEGEELMGIEIGFGGRGWYESKTALRSVSMSLLESGKTTREALRGMGDRSRKASYLNPHISDTAYYTLALAVPEAHRGRGLGAQLLTSAVEAARSAGYRELQLDVLSDNPAVKFYESMGLVCLAETIAPEPCREHGVPMEMRMALRL
ncbi:MAG: GNAT family N-acetyltransferase [Deltaproteobacteria bacterium]|nr:GNAT family N-acetyltransferase [Deltaproteobacteria bacterium]